jgi:hypothetical protein
MVVVFGNGVLFLFSLLLLWKTLPVGTMPVELPVALELVVMCVVGIAAFAFGASLWLVREYRRRLHAVKRLEVELGAHRELGQRLEEKCREQDVRLTRFDAVVAEKERLVRRELECVLEIETLRKALGEAEARREREQREQRSSGREFMHLLSRLQEKGRFVDFIMEEIGGYSDQQVGTAARFVHDGCRAVVREYLDLAPVQSGEEGASVTVSQPRHPAELQFLGKSALAFPVTGRLVHRGWKVVTSRLPHISTSGEHEQSADVIAPARVELV